MTAPDACEWSTIYLHARSYLKIANTLRNYCGPSLIMEDGAVFFNLVLTIVLDYPIDQGTIRLALIGTLS